MRRSSRRDFIGAVASGAAASLAFEGAAQTEDTSLSKSAVTEIERIIEAKGTADNGVFTVGIDRKDLRDIRWRGTVPFLPSFEINGDLVFQSVAGGDVMMNGDMALKTAEVNPFIDQLMRHGIIFQAEHQHFYDLEPDVWFVHFRAHGSPSKVAESIKAALAVTSTPFPQEPPANPKTPLPAKELGAMIGAKPTLGDDGVVSFDVPRRDRMRLGGVPINPYLNVATQIAFQPHGGGRKAVAVSDFGMTASEIQRVVGHMRGLGWDSGCLYNQETDEDPQLYFDHMVKTGDAIQLAHEIRSGLDLMNAARAS